MASIKRFICGPIIPQVLIPLLIALMSEVCDRKSKKKKQQQQT